MHGWLWFCKHSKLRTAQHHSSIRLILAHIPLHNHAFDWIYASAQFVLLLRKASNVHERVIGMVVRDTQTMSRLFIAFTCMLLMAQAKFFRWYVRCKSACIPSFMCDYIFIITLHRRRPRFCFCIFFACVCCVWFAHLSISICNWHFVLTLSVIRILHIMYNVCRGREVALQSRNIYIYSTSINVEMCRRNAASCKC